MHPTVKGVKGLDTMFYRYKINILIITNLQFLTSLRISIVHKQRNCGTPKEPKAGEYVHYMGWRLLILISPAVTLLQVQRRSPVLTHISFTTWFSILKVETHLRALKATKAPVKDTKDPAATKRPKAKAPKYTKDPAATKAPKEPKAPPKEPKA